MAKKKLDWYKMYPKDFDTDEAVKLMGLMEIGLFVMLLNHAWNNKSIPSDPESLARIARIPRVKFDPLWKLVSKCFVAREDGRLVNPRQEEERSEAKERSEHGKSGAEARWKGMPKRCSTDARASIEHQSSNATRVSVLLSDSVSKKIPELYDRYGEVVEQYPNPVDVDLGSQIWISLIDVGEIAEMGPVMAGLERWKKSQQWATDGGKYIPSIAKWLSYKRWKDEPKQAKEEW